MGSEYHGTAREVDLATPDDTPQRLIILFKAS